MFRRAQLPGFRVGVRRHGDFPTWSSCRERSGAGGLVRSGVGGLVRSGVGGLVRSGVGGLVRSGVGGLVRTHPSVFFLLRFPGAPSGLWPCNVQGLQRSSCPISHCIIGAEAPRVPGRGWAPRQVGGRRLGADPSVGFFLLRFPGAPSGLGPRNSGCWEPSGGPTTLQRRRGCGGHPSLFGPDPPGQHPPGAPRAPKDPHHRCGQAPGRVFAVLGKKILAKSEKSSLSG
jgi:hypothetical protein